LQPASFSHPTVAYSLSKTHAVAAGAAAAEAVTSSRTGVYVSLLLELFNNPGRHHGVS